MTRKRGPQGSRKAVEATFDQLLSGIVLAIITTKRDGAPFGGKTIWAHGREKPSKEDSRNSPDDVIASECCKKRKCLATLDAEKIASLGALFDASGADFQSSIIGLVLWPPLKTPPPPFPSRGVAEEEQLDATQLFKHAALCRTALARLFSIGTDRANKMCVVSFYSPHAQLADGRRDRAEGAVVPSPVNRTPSAVRDFLNTFLTQVRGAVPP